MRFLSSLGFRVFLGHVFVILFLSISILYGSFSLVKKYYLRSQKLHLERLGKVLADEVEKWRELGVLKNRLEKISSDLGIFVAVVDERGRVVAGRWEVEKGAVYCSVPLDSGGVLKLGFFPKDMEFLLKNLREEIFKVSLAVVFLSLLFSLVVSRAISRPIEELSEASKRVAQGDFKVRVFEKCGGEVGRLVESFNYMVERMENLFADLALKKNELKSIASSLEEGLLILDRSGRIILHNSSFKEMVGEEAEGRFYWELIPDPNLGEIVREAISGRKARGFVELGGRSFHVHASPLKDGGVSLVFQDITEKESFSKEKREFIANVTHELRTPLTAIKGYLETIEEDLEEDKKRLLEVVKRHTDRLIKLVEDLLKLQQVEEGKLEFKRVDLGRIVKDVSSLFEAKAKEKGISLEIDVEEGVFIMGDSFRLEELLFNLLHNAIKYTDKGYVRVSLKKEGKEAVLAVEDTGVGIPKEEIPKIFHRFYVGDRARGGSGLGLSIVKHIVMAHGGRIDVESQLGKGSIFTVRFPLAS